MSAYLRSRIGESGIDIEQSLERITMKLFMKLADKRQLINDYIGKGMFSTISRAPEQKWVGSMSSGHYTSTGEFTRLGWLRYYASNFDYVVMDDGRLLSFRRPTIDSCIAYDDECPDPLGDTEASRKSGFLARNRRNRIDCGLSASNRTENARVRSYRSCDDGDDVTFMRLDGYNRVAGETVTELGMTESQELAGIIDVLNADFDRRLQSYWKRYSNKVYSLGYWADR